MMQKDFSKEILLGGSLWFIDWLSKLFQWFGGSIKAQQKLVVDHTAQGVELETSDAALPEDKMFAQRQIYLEKAIVAAVAVLLFATAGQSALLTDNLQTTTTPALSDSPLTTQLDNSSVEGPRVLQSHRSCESEHENYCGNGGKCMYPQDNDKPSCICPSAYSGPRCLFYNQATRSLPELEQLIGIGFGVAILIIVLAIIIYCFAYKRCVKSAPLIKSVPSETSV